MQDWARGMSSGNMFKSEMKPLGECMNDLYSCHIRIRMEHTNVLALFVHGLCLETNPFSDAILM
jgi:hypothetical protein